MGITSKQIKKTFVEWCREFSIEEDKEQRYERMLKKYETERTMFTDQEKEKIRREWFL